MLLYRRNIEWTLSTRIVHATSVRGVCVEVRREVTECILNHVNISSNKITNHMLIYCN